MNKNIDQKMRYTELLTHSLLLSHHVFTSIYSDFFIDLTKSTSVHVNDIGTYKYRYFTTWNFVLQVVYLTIVFFNDMLKFVPQTDRVINAQKFIAKIRGFMYTSLVFPTGLFVFGMFWTIWNINRELVLPSAADEFLPLWFNHCIHTNILLLIVSELFFHKTLPSFTNAAKGCFVLSLCYNICFFFTYYQSSRWLYGLFGLFSWPGRVFFMIWVYFVSLVLIKLGMLVQKAVHKRALPDGSDHKLISKKLM